VGCEWRRRWEKGRIEKEAAKRKPEGCCGWMIEKKDMAG
jgi:hypothetical protein